MPNLAGRRKSLVTIITVVAVIDVVALVYLASPLGQSRAKRQEERDRVQLQLQARKREVAPLKDIDHKLELAKQQIADFYQDRFPSVYSSVADELGKLAQENNVRISQVRYAAKEADQTTPGAGQPTPGVQRMEIEANLDGDYLQVVKFINALERDKMFFLVDSIALTEQQGGGVKLQVKMETYLKA